MTIVKEVADALALIAGAVKDVQKIARAIKEGRDYVKQRHPNVADDLAAMCDEMRKSMLALAAASSIVTHFRFVLGDDLTGEGRAFRDLMVEHKQQTAELENQLDSMRGHCHVIGEHADAVLEAATESHLDRLFAVLGLDSAERELQLWHALESVAMYDANLDFLMREMASAVDRSLAEVQAELGPSGVIVPAQIPAAARVLGEYAEALAKVESACNFAALELGSTIESLLGRPV